MAKENETLYQALKQRALNSKFIVVLIIVGSVVVFLASTKESFQALFPDQDLSMEPTLTGTVLDERMYCGGVPVEEKEEVMIQKATLDLAVNNPSSRSLVIKSLYLKPLSLNASFWAGMLQVSAVYDAVLDEWHAKLMDAQHEWHVAHPEFLAGPDKEDQVQITRDLEVFRVSKISDDKFVIPNNGQERFQIKLGLTRSIDFLYGNIEIVMEFDNKTKVVSEPLWIVVCDPEFKMEQ